MVVEGHFVVSLSMRLCFSTLNLHTIRRGSRYIFVKLKTNTTVEVTQRITTFFYYYNIIKNKEMSVENENYDDDDDDDDDIVVRSTYRSDYYYDT